MNELKKVTLKDMAEEEEEKRPFIWISKDGTLGLK